MQNFKKNTIRKTTSGHVGAMIGATSEKILPHSLQVPPAAECKVQVWELPTDVNCTFTFFFLLGVMIGDKWVKK